MGEEIPTGGQAVIIRLITPILERSLLINIFVLVLIQIN